MGSNRSSRLAGAFAPGGLETRSSQALIRCSWPHCIKPAIASVTARGQAKEAVPIWTKEAPARAYSTAVVAVMTPPTPNKGRWVAALASRTARSPEGRSAGPLIPPSPAPSSGTPFEMSSNARGSVFTNVSAFAPSSVAT